MNPSTMEELETQAPKLKTILYVDDDPYMRLIVNVVLSGIAGIAVHTCSSGRVAVLDANRIVPDLLLLDVRMPEMDGPSTLLALRQLRNTASTPALFITGTPEDLQPGFCEQAGALGVITKPIDPLRFGAQLQAIWDGGASAPAPAP
ncbi:MAG: response regulator [Pseudomonadota bacterium]